VDFHFSGPVRFVNVDQINDCAIIHVDVGGSAAPRAMLKFCGFAA